MFLDGTEPPEAPKGFQPAAPEAAKGSPNARVAATLAAEGPPTLALLPTPFTPSGPVTDADTAPTGVGRSAVASGANDGAACVAAGGTCVVAARPANGSTSAAGLVLAVDVCAGFAGMAAGANGSAAGGVEREEKGSVTAALVDVLPTAAAVNGSKKGAASAGLGLGPAAGAAAEANGPGVAVGLLAAGRSGAASGSLEDWEPRPSEPRPSDELEAAAGAALPAAACSGRGAAAASVAAGATAGADGGGRRCCSCCCWATASLLRSRNLASFGGGAGSAKVAAEVGPRRRVATGAGRAPCDAVSMTPECRWCFCQMLACSVSTSWICKLHESLLQVLFYSQPAIKQNVAIMHGIATEATILRKRVLHSCGAPGIRTDAPFTVCHANTSSPK